MVGLLVYELVDEILDFGWPQSASTAELQPFIFNKAVEVSASKETVSGTGLSALKAAAPKTMSSKAVHKPISTRSTCWRWSPLPRKVFPR